MKSRLPKPYLKIGGKSILWYTLSRFRGLHGLKQVIISTSDDFHSEALESARAMFPDISVKCAQGGAERQQSIQNALDLLEGDIEYVIVHDAVRPFVNKNTINECLRVAENTGAAVVSIPAKDTIKIVNRDGFIEDTPDRKKVWQAQTPQIFKRELLERAYSYAGSTGFKGTDDASLVEHLGEKVSIVKGSHSNFKITYPLDMKYAELLLSEKNRWA